MSDVTREQLDALRRDFDASFALPAGREAPERVAILKVALGEARVVLRADQLRGIQHGRRLVQVRGGLPELLGIGGLQGEILPVYDLARLLRLGQGSRRWTWWALPAAGQALAFAFERLLGYAVAPLRDFTRASQPDPDGFEQFFTGDGGLVPVVDILRVTRAVQERLDEGAPQPQEAP